MARGTAPAARARPDARRGRVMPSGEARAVLVVVLVTLILRAPSLFEPQHYADEGIFAAVAQRLLQGHALYAGAWDDKPPLIYWLYAAVMAVAGPSVAALRALAALWAAAGAAAVTLLGVRMFGRRPGTAAGLVFATVASVTFFEGNLALTELFAATPAAWAMFLIARDGTRTRGCTTAGALLGVSFLFKQVFALDAAAAGLFLVLHGRAGVRPAGALAAGWLVPVLAAGVALAAQGPLTGGLRATFGFYNGYLSEGTGLPPAFAAAKFLPPVVACGWAMRAARRRSLALTELLVLWLGFACLGATFSGRPYGHYLIQVAAPIALCAVALARGAAVHRAATGLLVTALAGVMVIAGAFSRFWFSYPMAQPSYYANTAAYLTGLRSRAAYEAFFYWRVPVQESLARIIRADPERTLFVWGEYPWLYLLADAANPTRFTVAYHTAFVPGAKDEVMEALRSTPPRFIVWDHDEWRRLPGLETFVAKRYERLASIGSADLYRRRDAR